MFANSSGPICYSSDEFCYGIRGVRGIRHKIPGSSLVLCGISGIEADSLGSLTIVYRIFMMYGYKCE